MGGRPCPRGVQVGCAGMRPWGEASHERGSSPSKGPADTAGCVVPTKPERDCDSDHASQWRAREGLVGVCPAAPSASLRFCVSRRERGGTAQLCAGTCETGERNATLSPARALACVGLVATASSLTGKCILNPFVKGCGESWLPLNKTVFSVINHVLVIFLNDP